MRRITRIVITGGPCAGKTAAMDYLRHRYMEQGFRVLCIREAATDLMFGEGKIPHEKQGMVISP